VTRYKCEECQLIFSHRFFTSHIATSHHCRGRTSKDLFNRCQIWLSSYKATEVEESKTAGLEVAVEFLPYRCEGCTLDFRKKFKNHMESTGHCEDRDRGDLYKCCVLSVISPIPNPIPNPNLNKARSNESGGASKTAGLGLGLGIATVVRKDVKNRIIEQTNKDLHHNQDSITSNKQKDIEIDKENNPYVNTVTLAELLPPKSVPVKGREKSQITSPLLSG
jgi:hypothetical protein